MSELKNKFGNNVSWILIDVAEQIKCELEDSGTIETGFEIYGETEDGRETQCEVGLVDLLESASVAINDAESEITAITKQRDALLKELRDIQSSCIGEITMGYKLDAESIGASISKATGMTHPEIVSELNKGNTNPSVDWMSKLFSIVSRYNDFTKGWESWDDWGSYFNDGLSPQEAYAESMRTI